jgi:hypothetical protein
LSDIADPPRVRRLPSRRTAALLLAAVLTAAVGYGAFSGARRLGYLQPRGIAWRFTQGLWVETLLPPGTPTLYGVWAASASDVWAVGVAGTVLHYDGAGWAPVAAGWMTGSVGCTAGSIGTWPSGGGAGKGGKGAPPMPPP